MSGEDEGFLKRWSRLKRTGEIVPAPEAVPEPVAEEEIEIPPPADTIPLEDIASWLKKRLPAGWREVALRRVWSADIAIRDHIGLADYAWDFTVSGDMPGGVPGWGPLTASDDLASLLSRAIGEVQEIPDPAPDGRVSIPQELHQDAADEGAIPAELAPYEADVVMGDSDEPAIITDEPLQQTQVIPASPAPATAQDRYRRRGGGAAPVFLDDPAS